MRFILKQILKRIHEWKRDEDKEELDRVRHHCQSLHPSLYILTRSRSTSPQPTSPDVLSPIPRRVLR